MDQNALVTSGRELVRALDLDGIAIAAALWVHEPEADRWRLWIVPRSKVDSRDFYASVADTITKDRMRFGDMDASDTKFVKSDHPALKGLAEFGKIDGRVPIRLRNNMLNGFYLEDGIVISADL